MYTSVICYYCILTVCNSKFPQSAKILQLYNMNYVRGKFSLLSKNLYDCPIV